jgi:hypothetical protein
LSCGSFREVVDFRFFLSGAHEPAEASLAVRGDDFSALGWMVCFMGRDDLVDAVAAGYGPSSIGFRALFSHRTGCEDGCINLQSDRDAVNGKNILSPDRPLQFREPRYFSFMTLATSSMDSLI